MEKKFWPAGEPEGIAQELISEIHTHLVNVPIRYVFLAETPLSKGRKVLGRARKVSGLNAYLAQERETDFEAGDVQDDAFFVIEIASQEWGGMTQLEKRALVDHELSHFAVTYDDEGEQKLSIVGHDFEQFYEVIERNGDACKELHRIETSIRKAKKLPLFDGADEKESTVTISGGGKSVTMTDSEFKRAARRAKNAEV